MKAEWDGRRAFVRYRVREALFHCRALLWCVTDAHWMVLTPDHEMFMEEMAVTNGDLNDVVFCNGGDQMPPALAGRRVYDFDPPLTVATAQPYLDAAIMQVLSERATLGLPHVPPGIAGDPLRRAIAGLVPTIGVPPLDPGLPLEAPRGEPPRVEGGGAMVAVGEPPRAAGGLTPRLSDGGGSVAGGLHGNFGGAGGGLAGLRAALGGAGGDAGGGLTRPGGIAAGSSPPALGAGGSTGVDDARTLAVKFNSDGQRFRDFRSAVEDMYADTWAEWPVDGPRTFAWGVRFMCNQAGTPTGWHTKWRSDGKLDASSHIVAFHGVCCQMVETMMSFDQVNGPNLATAELLMRQIMLAEERLKDKFGNQAPDGFDEYHLYTGRKDRYALCIDPALSEWVSREVSKESAVLKERRKAREERALARPKKKGGKEGE